MQVDSKKSCESLQLPICPALNHIREHTWRAQTGFHSNEIKPGVHRKLPSLNLYCL